MQVMIYRTSDAISLIFFKLMFFFDEFQPGKTRYRAGKTKDAVMPARVFHELENMMVLNSAVKRNETDTKTVISMIHVLDPHNDPGIVIGFPLMCSNPTVLIHNHETRVSLCCDEAGKELQEGEVGQERPEEKKAFEYFLQIIRKVVGECIGNEMQSRSGTAPMT